MGIARRYMLKKNRDFQFLYRRGRSVSSPALALLYLPCKQGNFRVGFSVGKKLGNSVRRNRMKRLLRENFRQLLGEVNPCYRYIFTARQPLAGADYQTVAREMRELVRRAGLIKKEP